MRRTLEVTGRITHIGCRSPSHPLPPPPYHPSFYLPLSVCRVNSCRCLNAWPQKKKKNTNIFKKVKREQKKHKRKQQLVLPSCLNTSASIFKKTLLFYLPFSSFQFISFFGPQHASGVSVHFETTPLSRLVDRILRQSNSLVPQPKVKLQRDASPHTFSFSPANRASFYVPFIPQNMRTPQNHRDNRFALDGALQDCRLHKTRTCAAGCAPAASAATAREDGRESAQRRRRGSRGAPTPMGQCCSSGEDGAAKPEAAKESTQVTAAAAPPELFYGVSYREFADLISAVCLKPPPPPPSSFSPPSPKESIKKTTTTTTYVPTSP